MPELPEVETVINLLKSNEIIGLTIKEINIYKPKLLKNISPANIQSICSNKKIIDIKRLGKNILVFLSNTKTIVFHLRMEGKLFLENKNVEWIKKHLMIEFILNKNKVLRYYDTRMFGTIHVFDTTTLYSQPHIAKIAIDPLDKKFNGRYLKNILSSKTTPIKTCLLDQTVVSGIGNIYCDEILFQSGIHPLIKPINIQSFDMLATNATRILKKAISYKGTTVFSYRSSIHTTGEFQKHLFVYGRENEPCLKCKTKIVKIKVNGRGTYFCPKCQHL